MNFVDAILGYERQRGAPAGEAVRALLAAIQEADAEKEALRRLEGRDDPASCWLRAALLESQGAYAEADALYARVVDPAGREVPDAVLQRARLAARAGDNERAAALLRFVFQMHPPYSVFLRSEGLRKKLQDGRGARRRIRIALAGTSTLSFLRPALESLFFRDGIEASFYEAPFGALHSEILDDHSGLYRFAPTVVVLLVNWRDAGIGYSTANPDEAAARCVKDFELLWDRLRSKCQCQIIQTGFNIPAEDPYHALAAALPSGRARVLREMNRRLFEAASGGVTVLDAERMAALYGSRWEDPLKWSSAKIYPAPEATPVLAEHIASCVRAALGCSSKVLALDLDNTLWGGIIGEDGIGGIALGPPSPAGERFQEFQRYLKGLKERGVLLTVVSKNNPADAEQVFREHASTVLRLDDFVAFEANWDPKPESLKKIAARLALGLDAFVLLDDNPVERANMRSALPDVIVPEISAEPSDSIAALERGLYFQAITLTGEDLARSASYFARAQMETARGDAAALEQYLTGLGMEIASGPVDEVTCDRVQQLINKTNQFNLTTKRYTKQQVIEFMNSPRYWFRWFRLRDRFADHGLIAVLLAERLSADIWNIDTWLMSCRVISRGVENFMFNALLRDARSEQVKVIRAWYAPTPKNALVKDLLPDLGFMPAGAAGEFELTVDVAEEAACPGLRQAAQVA
jgi:FkbH-like protein